MTCKTFSLLALLTLLSLVVGVPGTFAQTPQPPERPYPPGSERPVHYPTQGAGVGEEPFRHPVNKDVDAQSLSPAVKMGEPGTSFRYVETFGMTEEPYLSDSKHINRPIGLFMDSGDNLFVVEEQGHRLLKYNSLGNNKLILGKAGVCDVADYTFCGLQDVATDSDGNIWIVDSNRVVQYSPVGVFLQQFPETEPWVPGQDNTRFDWVHGVAFNNSKQMFVSDTKNHRIQVFDLSSGSPVYTTTIGTSGVPGSGNNQFSYPYRLGIDSQDRLYVVDNGNNRVQRCTFSGSWNCSTFATGLNNPQGIALDGNDNVYIADHSNGRIRKCSPAGACNDLVTNTYWLYDLALDSNGNIYGAAAYEDIVVKFNPSGELVEIFKGVEFVPYLTDKYHYNHPRVDIDNSDNIIVAEENGQRLVKLDSNGVPLWSVGVPGVDAWDNEHFMYPHGVATDRDGNIYVADGIRVQIYTGEGDYIATLGTGYGSGDYEFTWAAGIAVEDNGNIYVSDAHNHRVQIYNSDLVYLGTLGVTGEPGSDNGHFYGPIGVEVDGEGNIYVADINNCRVQKFNSNLVYQMTFGTTGSCGDSFAELSAEDVTVDAKGRVYVSGWNSRVQVFDSQGAYLTTIGGAWGTNSSQFRGASGVAVDSQGNVYVSDFDNARIQKFTPGFPGWVQTNINGFGDRWNTWISSLEVFNGQFYAGTANWDKGGTIWRSNDGINWTKIIEPGFGEAYGNTNPVIVDMFEFKNKLYATTGWGGIPGQIWRSSNGTDWIQVVADGFGDPQNGAITVLEIFKDQLYASTHSPQSNGIEVWRSATGDTLDWTRVVSDGYGDANNVDCTGLIEFDGYLYAAVENNEDGLEVWRSPDGTGWNQVNVNGFGDANNNHTSNWATLNGYLYLATRNYSTGGQVWRTSNGTIWEQVLGNGFGNLNNQKIDTLYTYGNQIYAVTENYVTGEEVWKSSNGITWSQTNPDGFGDSNNVWTFWSPAIHVFINNLYIGTTNSANGGEIWKKLNDIFLPVIVN